MAIGALTRHRVVETSSVLAEHVPLLAAVAAQVGDNQVRHRGTIGGSIAHADPASDLPAATLALGATYVVQGPGGRREIAASEFYRGFLESALAADEMLVEIRVPKMGGAGWSFHKFNRRAQDWAIVGVAAWRRRRPGPGSGWSTWVPSRSWPASVADAHRRRGLDRRCGRTRRRPTPNPKRPQRHQRIPHPPRQNPHPPRPHRRHQLAVQVLVDPDDRRCSCLALT